MPPEQDGAGPTKQADTNKARTAVKKESAAGPDDLFANLEVAAQGDASGIDDFSALGGLDVEISTSAVNRKAAAGKKAAAEDEIQLAPSDARKDASEKTSSKASRRGGEASPQGAGSTLSGIADTADQMQPAVQAVAYLTFAGCALAGLVGLFWVVRAAPEGLWAFTIAGASLAIGAGTAAIAAKNLLTYFQRVDAFADKRGSKELARQMIAAKKFWKSAMVAVIVTLVLAVVSLLAFAFAPVEGKAKEKMALNRIHCGFAVESLIDS